MRIWCKICICVIFLMVSKPLPVLSQVDSLCIYFQRGYAVVNLSLRENSTTFKNLIDILQNHKDAVKLQLTGNASPDGSASANMRLTRKRVAAVLSYLREYVPVSDSLITVKAKGIDWDGLSAMVEKDANCPAREEVLVILKEQPEWVYDAQNRIIDGRKKQLMDLRGGVPYNYLSEKFFPELRNTTVALSYKDDTKDLQAERQEEGDAVVEEYDSSSHPSSNEVVGLENDEHDAFSSATVSSSDAAADDRVQRMAIKTNFLYDAILMPSLEVEYRIDNRWSVAVEGSVAWWKRDSRHKYYQIATIVPEGRYWFRTRKPWHGHYVGLFAGGSWYDLENGGRGYKGEFFMTGLSYGYMFPISRFLSLETGLGVGFLHTSYEEYLPLDGHYVYQQTSKTNWVGPVKLKFSLVWRLWDKQERGSR